MSVGPPEITVIFLMSALWLIPVAAAVWALVTLNRLRVTQEAMRRSLDAIAHSLQRSLDRVQPEQQGTAGVEAGDNAAAVCAWCGRPVTEEEAFTLRVGARLCPSCAEEAGRIAAQQRLGSEPARPPGEK
jgi:hypothetical protein